MAESVEKVTPAPIQLDQPKDTPFTVEELAKYDGTGDCGIYVAIKGTIFDGKRSFHAISVRSGITELTFVSLVSAKKDMYGPGCGYHVRGSLAPRISRLTLQLPRSSPARMLRPLSASHR